MAFIQDKLTKNVDTVEEFIGFKLPVTFESVHLSTTSLESTQTNLTNLLSTQKGERMFQPNLGINLRRHLFNPINAETSVALQEDILEQIAIWLPFLEVQDVIITPNEGNNLINIKINYSFKSNSELTESVQVDLNTGATY